MPARPCRHSTRGLSGSFGAFFKALVSEAERVVVILNLLAEAVEAPARFGFGGWRRSQGRLVDLLHDDAPRVVELRAIFLPSLVRGLSEPVAESPMLAVRVAVFWGLLEENIYHPSNSPCNVRRATPQARFCGNFLNGI